jgi:arylsulfatase
MAKRNLKTASQNVMWRSTTLVSLSLATGILTGFAGCSKQESSPAVSFPGFQGTIKLDVRDSVQDWKPFTAKKAPDGAPNFLFILYDDTGLAAWSTYGGRINMPTLDRLAANGLTYTQWHTTALCSPSRSTILTGRNHHLNGMAAITEAASGFPGASGRIPDQAATAAQILQDGGWSTFWVGKNHNVAEQDVASGASRKQWPIQKGFDRFYGFLGGETNQWYPDLVEDNRFIEPPYAPEQGYHLSKDLADKAIGMIRDQKASNPSRPWYTWFNPGANHAPHHAPKDYIAKYKGKFDDGYEAYRTWVLQRMIDKGILPKGTRMTPLNPLPKEVANPGDYVRPWDSLSPDEKKLLSRLAEVYAAYSEYTDAQVGRIIDYLQESGQLENTVIFYAADNGASGEGSPNGSVNENKFFNGYPDTIAENIKYLDELGGPGTYEHYPTGWAAAFSTPFQMFKRYAEYSGGTSDPLVISWPKGIKARGEIRHQYHHSVDIVPTILEIAGLDMPKVYKGVDQYPLSGISMRYTFDAKPDDPTKKQRQYYAMLGTRGLWENGWLVSCI